MWKTQMSRLRLRRTKWRLMRLRRPLSPRLSPRLLLCLTRVRCIEDGVLECFAVWVERWVGLLLMMMLGRFSVFNSLPSFLFIFLAGF